ncbi:hypothetical protein CUMW_099180 [Citrus unshiu]|nr:hypothetical protein CUMW_099180 [Citrus unshiu]
MSWKIVSLDVDQRIRLEKSKLKRIHGLSMDVDPLMWSKTKAKRKSIGTIKKLIEFFRGDGIRVEG